MKQIIDEWLRDLSTPGGYLGILLGLLLAYLLVSGYRLVRIISLKKILQDKRYFLNDNDTESVLQHLLYQYEELYHIGIIKLFSVKELNFYQKFVKKRVEPYYNQYQKVKKSADSILVEN